MSNRKRTIIPAIRLVTVVSLFAGALVSIASMPASAGESFTLTVVVDGYGTGKVTSDPGDIDCGSVCSDSFSDGTQVTLTQEPDKGSDLGGWDYKECFQETSDCVVTVNDPLTVTATFDDGTPPSPTPTLDEIDFLRSSNEVDLSWSESTDPESGLWRYQAQKRFAKTHKPMGLLYFSAGDTTGTSTQVTGKLGWTYCLAVQAENNDGRLSDPSNEECTTIPRDDRAFRRSQGDWHEGSGSGYFKDTFLRSKEKGATLNQDVTDAKTVGLVATKCPGCGRVKLFLEGDFLRAVSLDAPTKQKGKIFVAEPLAPGKTGKFEVRVVSDDKPVLIDGLIASPLVP